MQHYSWQDLRTGRASKADMQKHAHSIYDMLHDTSNALNETVIKEITLRPDGVRYIIHVLGHDITLASFDKTMPFSLLYSPGIPEAKELRAMCALLRPGWHMLDIGANMGWYSILLPKLIPGLMVHSFEPAPETFARLRSNCEDNGISTQRLFNFGLSDHSGSADFYYNADYTGASGQVDLGYLAKARKMTCAFRRLDDFAREQGLKQLDFIKCDVEGGELKAMQGGLKTIRRFQPVILLEMLRKWSAKYGYHPNDIIALLKNEGYQCHVAREDGQLEPFAVMDESTEETKFFFVPQDL